MTTRPLPTERRRRLRVTWFVSILLMIIMMGTVLCLIPPTLAQDMHDNDNNNDDDDTGRQRRNKRTGILLAHIAIDSTKPDQPRKAAGLPQTISVKKAHRLLEQAPIRYYAGNVRARMHVVVVDDATTTTTNNNKNDEFYVWYAARGPDLQRDGYYLQVFQFPALPPHKNDSSSFMASSTATATTTTTTTTTTTADMVSAMQQFGELDEENPFCRFDTAQIWQYMHTLARQRLATTLWGLHGVHIQHLHAWKRSMSFNMSARQVDDVMRYATVRAQVPGGGGGGKFGFGFLKGAVRLRTWQPTQPHEDDQQADNVTNDKTDDDKHRHQQQHQQPAGSDHETELYYYVLVEEDSDFGHLYDATLGVMEQWWSRTRGGNGSSSSSNSHHGTSWARKWGRYAIYKFVAGTTTTTTTTITPAHIKAAMRAYPTGKTDSKRLEQLLNVAWPKQQQQQDKEEEEEAQKESDQGEETSDANTWRNSVDLPDASTDEEL